MELFNPKDGTVYYFVTDEWDVTSFVWSGDVIDFGLYGSGNCFETQEEAKAFAAQIRALRFGTDSTKPEAEPVAKKETELPDWCKPGAWVYDTSESSYARINTIDEFYVDFISYSLTKEEFVKTYVEARVRRKTYNELRSLVGKVIYYPYDNAIALCTSVEDLPSDAFIQIGNTRYSATELAETLLQTEDGELIGPVKEHYDEEREEWVK